MSITFKSDGVTLDPDRVRLVPPGDGGVAGLPSAAFNGEVSIAGLQVDDPDGDYDFLGLKPFTVEESDCVGKERIFTGWSYGRRVSRGPYRSGAGRVWDCDIVDQNFAFGLKVFRASTAKRPAESDIVRADWALGQAPFSPNPVYEGAFSNFTDNPVNFGPSDYVTQYPLQLFQSIAGTSGKNFYAFWNHTTDRVELYYDQSGAVERVSTLNISNVEADQDATTFFPFIDAELDRSPDDVNSGILLGYLGGWVYAQRQQTITDYMDRDLVYRTDRVGKQATAEALVQTMLVTHSLEADTITCTIRVPSSQVNLIEAGEWVDVKFTHLPDLGSFTQLPVIRRNVRLTNRRDTYEIDLELSKKTAAQGPGAGPGVVVPHRPSCEPGYAEQVQEVTGQPALADDLDLPSTPTPGNTIIVYGQKRVAGVDNPDPPIGFTDSGAGRIEVHETTAAVWYRFVQPGDTAHIGWAGGSTGLPPDLAYAEERTGQLTPEVASLISADPYNTNSPFPGAAITPDSGKPGVVTSYWFAKRDHGSLAADTGWILLDAQTVSAVITHAIIEKVVAATSGTYTPSFTGANPAVFDNHGYGSITLAFTCDSSPPATAQQILNEVVAEGDGTTVTFNTAYAYVPGSLKVRVDGVPIITGLTESDPDTGEFSLDFAPLGAIGDSRAELVVADYQAQ